MFRELQELSFANRYPFRYKVLYDNVLKTRNNRRAILERILNETKASLSKSGIRCRILGRDKTIYGIYNKMREKHQPSPMRSTLRFSRYRSLERRLLSDSGGAAPAL